MAAWLSGSQDGSISGWGIRYAKGPLLAGVVRWGEETAANKNTT